MSRREARRLAIALGAVVVIGGLIVAHQLGSSGPAQAATAGSAPAPATTPRAAPGDAARATAVAAAARTEQLHASEAARQTEEEPPAGQIPRRISPEEALQIVARTHGQSQMRWVGLTSQQGRLVYRVQSGETMVDVDAATGKEIANAGGGG